jgi:hypothetical protein
MRPKTRDGPKLRSWLALELCAGFYNICALCIAQSPISLSLVIARSFLDSCPSPLVLIRTYLSRVARAELDPSPHQREGRCDR